MDDGSYYLAGKAGAMHHFFSLIGYHYSLRAKDVCANRTNNTNTILTISQQTSKVSRHQSFIDQIRKIQEFITTSCCYQSGSLRIAILNTSLDKESLAIIHK